MFEKDDVSWWKPVVFAAMAGGMGWGIRGQYGHESGAMNAGVLVSLTLCFWMCRMMPMGQVVRAAAMGILAMGFGGSMTYGANLGLTQDAAFVGNWAALRWGLLGVFIKGGIWISFFALFFSIGLSGIRYRGRDILLVMVLAVLTFPLGIWLLNMPFDSDPANKVLPKIMFSCIWLFNNEMDYKPRFECWGGLLVSLGVVFSYASFLKKDALVRNMALWGFLGGGLGFMLGQCLQAWNAWNPGVYEASFMGDIYINWWNLMETTFGTIMGGIVALGLWLNREKIQLKPEADIKEFCIPVAFEIVLIMAHFIMLACLEFYYVPVIELLYGFGLPMLFIPMVSILGGRWMAYLVVFPLTLQTIAGKTLKHVMFHKVDGELMLNEGAHIVLPWMSNDAPATMAMNIGLASFVYVVVPLAISVGAAIFFCRKHQGAEEGHLFAGIALVITGWSFFLLNWAVFNNPWPWQTWGTRHSSGFWFTVCIFVLTAMVLFMKRRPALPGTGESNE